VSHPNCLNQYYTVFTPSLEMVTVREDKQRLIRAALVNNPELSNVLRLRKIKL
jgi:hypothetical protein